MPKYKSLFLCANCSYESPKWLGQCPSCGEWNTLEEVSNQISDALNASNQIKTVNLKSISKLSESRTLSGISEFDRVLGGGFVTSSVILISGEPGIGKSTLLMQIISSISKKVKSVYVSGEESVEQLAIRASRLYGVKKDINIISGFEINSIIKKIKSSNYKFVILDSIQSFYSEDSRGLPGGFSQVKSVASKLVKFAKENGVIMAIVGQITKSGLVAGPKLLEHLVDVVLQLEGDEDKYFRLLRSFKNRYGSINEVGLFEMTDFGMKEIPDISTYFRDSSKLSRNGICLGAVTEGNRVFILEVQALTSRSIYSLPKRISSGISKSKLELLCAIISKYTKTDLSNLDIYINIAGGIKVKDPSIDLPIVIAILSSVKNKNISQKLVAFGEVSLTGAIRKGSRYKQKESDLKRLGYTSFNKKYPQIEFIDLLVKFIK